MKIAEAKAQFIQDWGLLANAWGSTRAMGHIHGYLLTESEPRTADEIVEALSISRGNGNQTIRELVDWGLVHRIAKQGVRKELFQAEKDIWKIAQAVAITRARKELQPLQTALSKYRKLEGPKAEVQEFRELLQGIERAGDIAGKMLELLGRTGLIGFVKLFQ